MCCTMYRVPQQTRGAQGRVSALPLPITPGSASVHFHGSHQVPEPHNCHWPSQVCLSGKTGKNSQSEPGGSVVDTKIKKPAKVIYGWDFQRILRGLGFNSIVGWILKITVLITEVLLWELSAVLLSKRSFYHILFSQQNYPALTVINNQELVIKLVFTENRRKWWLRKGCYKLTLLTSKNVKGAADFALTPR